MHMLFNGFCIIKKNSHIKSSQTDITEWKKDFLKDNSCSHLCLIVNLCRKDKFVPITYVFTVDDISISLSHMVFKFIHLHWLQVFRGGLFLSVHESKCQNKWLCLFNVRDSVQINEKKTQGMVWNLFLGGWILFK